MRFFFFIAASTTRFGEWVPFLLLPLSSWLVQAQFELALCWVMAIILLMTYFGSKYALVCGTMALCSLGAYWDPFLLTANIVLACRLKKGSLLAIWTTLFLCLQIRPLPLWTSFPYFWGLPFLALATGAIYGLLLRRLTEGGIKWTLSPKKLATGCLALVCAMVVIQTADVLTNNDVHYGATRGLLTDNFLRNAVPSGRFVPEDSDAHGTRTSFVFEKEAVNEENLNKSPKGTYILLGEHDNMNGFVTSNPSFNDDVVRQYEPWGWNRPAMSAFLRIASMKDPFYCSNLGATLKWDDDLVPLAWRYSPSGMPQIVVGEKERDGRRLILAGDSDIAISFLAPYNANFLTALYSQNSRSCLLYLCALLLLLALVAFRGVNSQVVTVFLCILPALFFVDPIKNSNKFDVLVRFHGIPVKSAHTDNAPEKIVNVLAREGLSVTMSKGDPQNSVHVVGDSIHLEKEGCEKRTVVLLLPGASLIYGDRKYVAQDLPLGAHKVDVPRHKTIVIPDARELTVNGAPLGTSLASDGKVLIIGTSSPQRMTDLPDLLTTYGSANDNTTVGERG